MSRDTIRLSIPAPRSRTTAGYRRPLLAAVLTLASTQWAGHPVAVMESLQPLADGSLGALAFCYAVWWSLLLWAQLATDRWAGRLPLLPG